MSEEKIQVEEEAVEEVEKETGERNNWMEEFVIASSQVVGFIKNLVHEAIVRRIVIKNEKQNIHFEVPFLLGLGSITIAHAYVALGLIAILATDCSIFVTRSEKEPEPEVEIAVE